MSFGEKQRRYPSVCVKARISCICVCTFFQFASVIGGDSNSQVVRGESSYGLVISMVKMVTAGGLTDSSNVCGSGLSLFFCGVLEINFLMSSGIMANLREWW